VTDQAAQSEELRRCVDCGRFHRDGACRRNTVEGRRVSEQENPPRPADKPPTSAKRRQAQPEVEPEVQPAEALRGVTAEDILASLIKLHALETPFHKAMALQIVNAVVRGDLAEATRAIALLPEPRITSQAGSTHGSASARERVVALIASVVAGDQVEQAGELERLRAENTELRRLLAGAEPVSGTSAKVITPGTGDIVPPCEQSDLPANMRGAVGPDDGKYKPGRHTVIEGEPVGVNGGVPQACSGEEAKRRMDEANARAAVETRRIMSEPGRPWEAQPSGDGVYSWLSRLNGRSW
jgi:hypothetical protein